MKQSIRLTETELKGLIKECLNEIGLGSFNQKNFYGYEQHPEYMSGDYKKMYGINNKNVKKTFANDDTDAMGFIQRDIKNLGDIINAKKDPLEKVSYTPGDEQYFGNVALMLSETGLSLAQEHGLKQYYNYLQNLRSEVEKIMKRQLAIA